jgi:hypothetical protein
MISQFNRRTDVLKHPCVQFLSTRVYGWKKNLFWRHEEEITDSGVAVEKDEFIKDEF